MRSFPIPSSLVARQVKWPVQKSRKISYNLSQSASGCSMSCVITTSHSAELYPLLSLGSSLSFFSQLLDIFAAQDVLSNSRLIAGSRRVKGQRSGGNQGWKRWGIVLVPPRERARAVSRTIALVLADNISWPRWASRCFIAPPRELESRSFHEGRTCFDTIPYLGVDVELFNSMLVRVA